jgi:protoporphyrinogen oxidase
MDEYFGSESPGTGWISAGAGRWLRSLRGQRESSNGEKKSHRIAIVGGGPGGLFAAYILNRRMPKASVTIYEADDEVGGKIMTDEFSDGTQFEAGVAELYEYLGPGGKDPLRLLIEKDLGLETADIAGGAIILQDEICRDIDEVEESFGYDTRKRIEAFHRKMAELMPLEKYAHRWQPDNEHPWADKTFREALHEEIPDDPVARHHIETAVHSDLATESHTCNGLNGIKNILMDNSEYMQLYHVIGGIGRIVEELDKKIDADKQTSTRVTRIAKMGSQYRVFYRSVAADLISEDFSDFDAVVVAMPNHWLRMIQWEGETLSEAIHSIVAHYDLPAHYLRVSMLFKTKWWKKLKLPGEFWMMDAFHGCAVYDESTRWKVDKDDGHVLSFLIAGGDALLLCSSNQDDDCIVDCVLESLPPFMREDAENELLEAQVDRYVGSLNAQPGGWPAEELRGEHQPEPKEHPGLFIVGDYLFDSTLNGALMSANTAIELLLEHFDEKSAEVTQAIENLESNGNSL